MKLRQITNTAFRCPRDLKKRLEACADNNNQYVSSVIRSACSDWLKNAHRVALIEHEEAFQARSRAYRRFCAEKNCQGVL
jgi:hypothetical protein